MTNSRHAQPTRRAHRHMGPRGATPRTRPPAPPPLGRWPQTGWAVHCTTPRPRALVPATSIKRTSSSNPDRPLRSGCCRPAPPGTSGVFYPDTRLSWLPPASRNPAPAPCHHHGYPQQIVSRVAQSFLGRDPKAAGTGLMQSHLH